MIKHLRIWETENRTHPAHNGIVTQGFFDYPEGIYNKLKEDTKQFNYGTTFRIEQEYPKGKLLAFSGGIYAERKNRKAVRRSISE